MTTLYMCSQNQSVIFVLYFVIKAIISELHLPEIFMCYAIFCIKPAQDVLQGLNKLDHIIKVSTFQVYKNELYNKNCYSIVSDSEFTNEYAHLETNELKADSRGFSANSSLMKPISVK